MRKGLFASGMRRAAALAAATAAVAACALLALPGTALAADSVGSALYYPSKDSIPHPIVGTYTSESSLLSKALDIAKDSSIYKVVVSLDRDWNTKDYGRILIPEGANVEFRLNGHMLDRDVADSTYYGVGKGDVFLVSKNATLTIEGGGKSLPHKGELSHDGKFWESKSNGSDLIVGGLIAGGANDSIDTGGGISVYGANAKVYLRNVTLAGNVSDTLLGVHGLGGGVYLHGEGSYLELDNAKVLYNRAELSGGGIYVDGKNASIVAKNNSSVTGNSAVAYGGGISYIAKGGSISLTNSIVDDNVVDGAGAGIYDKEDGTTINLDASSVSGNVNNGTYTWASADDRGRAGGIYLDDSATVNMSNGSKISNNKARVCGGIYMDDVETLLTMDGASLIEKNVTTGYAGGIGMGEDRQNIVMKGGSKICGNTAGAEGGGIHISDDFSFTSSHIRIQMEGGSSICDNKATAGGGIYNTLGGTVHLTSSDATGTITRNTADKCGGIYEERGTVLLSGVSVSGNTPELDIKDPSNVKEDPETVDLSAPVPSYEPANDGTGVQKVTLEQDSSWPSGSDCKIYYALVSTDEAEDYAALGDKKYEEYTGSIELGPRQMLATYAQFTIGSISKKTPIGLYGRSLLFAQVEASKATYAADGPRCTVTVTLDGQKLVEGEDYYVMYSTDCGVGSVDASIYALGGFIGCKDFEVTVVPADMAGVKAKAAGNGKVKVSWGKHKAQTSGFAVSYAASKAKLAAGKGKTVKVKGASKKSCIVKGLKSGKKSYFKVRAYKVVGGKTYYSAWSKVKVVKVK